ncbi:MAG: hypothetical protein OXT49_00110 [Gammaproteobacteria bacterium]|nr:hypothetical protein [Gammaproteobacteria bacterium]
MLKSVKTTAKILSAGLLAGAAVSAPSVASAAAYELSEEQKRAIVALLTAPKAAPGIGIGVPTGFGAGQGQVYASIGGTTTKDASNEDDYDGSASVGIGFGDANEFVALELQANIISLTDNADDSDFGEEGSISAKLSRNVGRTSAISFGAENISTWGDSLDDTDASAYIAFTTVKALSDNPSNPLTLSFTIGAGTERFQDLDNGVRDSGPGIFGALALAVHRQVGLIADYNGNYTSVGLSLVPLRSCPLTVTLSAVNVNEVSAADGGTSTGDTEFGGSIGYSWNF